MAAPGPPAGKVEEAVEEGGVPKEADEVAAEVGSVLKKAGESKGCVAATFVAGGGKVVEGSSVLLESVPHLVQLHGLDCGPTALRMACMHLMGKDGDPGADAAMAAVAADVDRSVSTIKLAIAARRLRLGAAFVSTSLQYNPDHDQNPYYQAHGDSDATSMARLVAAATEAGVVMKERSVTLDAILATVTPASIPIVLVDVSFVYADTTTAAADHRYCGHFLIVVGFDDTHVIVHDQDAARPRANLRIRRQVFEAARKASGTDEDVVVLFRP